MMIQDSRFKIQTPGFTLMEMLVYVAIFAIISVFLVRTLLTVHAAYTKLQNERDVTAALRTSMEALGREVRAATSVYTPTSRFDSAESQLSLELPLASSASEAISFVDFYLDNGRLYMKREGEEALPITGEAVRVAQFRAERPMSGARESVRITLGIESRLPGHAAASSTVTSSFAPRNTY